MQLWGDIRVMRTLPKNVLGRVQALEIQVVQAKLGLNISSLFSSSLGTFVLLLFKSDFEIEQLERTL